VLASSAFVVREVAVEERPGAAGEAQALATELRRGGEGINRRRRAGGRGRRRRRGGWRARSWCPSPRSALGSATRLTTLPGAEGAGWSPTDGEPLRLDAVSRSAPSTRPCPRAPTSASSARRSSWCASIRGRFTSRPDRRGWAPQGVLASLADLHPRGCAVTLFRYPVDEQTSKGPALVCPCHYSTFDVRKAAKPVFGPAARALPQLPLAIAADGTLVAAGPLSGSVGPAWCGARSDERQPGAQGDALRLPRPLDLPARRDRALLVRRPRRHGVYLALFFTPDVSGTVVYNGPFEALLRRRGSRRPTARRSSSPRPSRAGS